MLVLSRRKGQSIMIGQDINLVVLGISRSRVRLAIEAPSSVDVDRTEIWLRKQIDCVESEITPGKHPTKKAFVA